MMLIKILLYTIATRIMCPNTITLNDTFVKEAEIAK